MPLIKPLRYPVQFEWFSGRDEFEKRERIYNLVKYSLHQHEKNFWKYKSLSKSLFPRKNATRD